MTHQPGNSKRSPGGKWLAGASANPTGRPRGRLTTRKLLRLAELVAVDLELTPEQRLDVIGGLVRGARRALGISAAGTTAAGTSPEAPETP